MQERKSNIRLILFFVIGVLILNGIAYAIWSPMPGFGASIMILAPILCAYFTVILSKKTVKINIKGPIFPSIMVGAAISFGYISVSVFIMLFIDHQFTKEKLTLAIFVPLCIQWIFAGFCEEVGWRGVLFPLLKKVTSYSNACVLTGVVWFLWHMPLILTGAMLKQFTWMEGGCLFLLEIISLSFIMGAISETRYGASIWTFVALHAVHNILMESMNTFLSRNQLRLLDNGYVQVFVLLGVALVFHYIIIVRRQRKSCN